VKDILNCLIEQYKKFSGIAMSTFESDLGSLDNTFELDLGSLDNTFLNIVDNTKSVIEKFHYISSQHLVEENDLDCKLEVDSYFLDECEKQ
jgi:hypothetical protein